MFGQEWLIVGLPPSQGLAADAMLFKMELGADQAVGPMRVHGKRASQQRNAPLVVGTSEIDDRSLGNHGEIERPFLGEGTALGGRLLTYGVTSTVGRDELAGLRPEIRSRVESEAVPDLGLPASVVALDASLKTGFTGRRKDRSDVQTQAKTRDASQGVWMDVRTVKHGIVVELGVVRQAKSAPMAHQRLHHDFACDCRVRPRGDQPAVQGNPIEDFYAHTALDDQSLDDVEAVQLGLLTGKVGQVPTSRWGRPAEAGAPQKAGGRRGP